MKTYVGAYNYEAFLAWYEKYNHNPRTEEVYYLHRAELLLGVNPNESQFLLIPGFWLRKDAKHISYAISETERMRTNGHVNSH